MIRRVNHISRCLFVVLYKTLFCLWEIQIEWGLEAAFNSAMSFRLASCAYLSRSNRAFQTVRTSDSLRLSHSGGFRRRQFFLCVGYSFLLKNFFGDIIFHINYRLSPNFTARHGFFFSYKNRNASETVCAIVKALGMLINHLWSYHTKPKHVYQ